MSLTRDSINAIHELLDKTLLTTTDKTVIGAINEINALRGQPNGIAELDGAGLIPSAQLPSYVDDVIEVATYAALPAIGETGKIYIVVADETSNGDTSSYRWTGTMYAMVSNTLTAADIDALGINASTVNGLTVQTAVPVGALFTDTVYDDSTTTKQGNTFNGVSQLVQTDGTGKLPAIDGSQLTGLPSGGSEHYDQGTAPVSPTLGATWYVPSTSITYKYVNDGTNSVWVDISTAGVSAGAAGGGGGGMYVEYSRTTLPAKVLLMSYPTLFDDVLVSHPNARGVKINMRQTLPGKPVIWNPSLGGVFTTPSLKVVNQLGVVNSNADYAYSLRQLGFVQLFSDKTYFEINTRAWGASHESAAYPQGSYMQSTLSMELMLSGGRNNVAITSTYTNMEFSSNLIGSNEWGTNDTDTISGIEFFNAVADSYYNEGVEVTIYAII